MLLLPNHSVYIQGRTSEFFCPNKQYQSTEFTKMDPTTSSHLDSATLNHQPATAAGDVPSLKVQSTADIKSKSSSTDGPAATGLRQRVNNLGSQLDQATDHPAVKNAKDVAGKQVSQFREFLGNFPAVRDLEKRFGVDRVALVVGGVFA